MPESESPESRNFEFEATLEDLENRVEAVRAQTQALGLFQDDVMAEIIPVTSPTTPAAPSEVYALGFATEIGVAWQFAKVVGSRRFGVEVRRDDQASMATAVSLGEFHDFFLIDNDNNRRWGTSVTRYYQARTVARSGETNYFSAWTPATPVSGTTLAAGSSNTDLQTRMDTFAGNVQRLHLLPGALDLSALSQAVSVLSQQVSVLSQAISVVSTAASNALSVANAASNAASVVSQAVSVLSQTTSVAQAALSVRVDTQSQSISVLSQQVSVLSQAVSVADAALSVRIDTQSQSISVLSQQVSGLSQAISVLSQGLSVVSNAASNALSVANAASNAASVVSAAVNVVSNALSNELSVRAAAVNVVSNAASNALSVANAASNAASVVSQALSVETANRTSAVSALLPTAPGGRLTLTTATPVMIATVTAATTIYYTPYVHQLVPIYDGTTWAMYSVAEISIAIDSTNHLSGKNYDLFVVNDAGTRRVGTGAAWTNDTTRAEALARLNGILTNNASFTFRYSSVATLTVAANRATYVGTFRASANGQTQMKFSQPSALFLWNMYQRVPFPAIDLNTTSHSYTTAAWRAWNNDAANSQVEIVVGEAEWVVAVYRVNNTASVGGGVSLGLDSTGGPGFPKGEQLNNVADVASSDAANLTSGYHFIVFVEYAGTSLTSERCSLTAWVDM